MVRVGTRRHFHLASLQTVRVLHSEADASAHSLAAANDPCLWTVKNTMKQRFSLARSMVVPMYGANPASNLLIPVDSTIRAMDLRS
jgi:hypothetical protein